MTVYVDDMNLRADVPNGDRVVRGKWSHLTADSEAELRAFAETIGLRQEWIQHPGEPGVHFDVTVSKRQMAIANGAKEITWREAGERYAAAQGSARAAEHRQPASDRQRPAEGRVRHSWADGPDGTRTCQREGCGIGAEQRWNPATGRPLVIYSQGVRRVVAERVPPCGSQLPDNGLTREEAAHLAETTDRKAGEAFKAGDLDRAFRLITDARVLDPGRAQLWNQREAQIRAKTNHPVKAAEPVRDDAQIQRELADWIAWNQSVFDPQREASLHADASGRYPRR